LDNLEIVDRKPDDLEKVYFGAWIKLEDETGTVKVLRIVGADEFDLEKGWISLESPVAKGLIGKQKGDDVMIMSPQRQLKMTILDVGYEEMS
jgi:transcription elongation factor GreB